jgi:hypothetical protein
MLRRTRHDQPPAAPVPRTIIGRFLRAMTQRNAELRKQMTAKLNGGKPGWNYDEPAVVQAACELAVSRLWGTSYDIRDITALVTFIRTADIERRGRTKYGQLEMEAVIRSTLGEIEVDTSGINPQEIFEIQGVMVGAAIRKLGLSQSEIDQLLVEAENIAFERGFNPPLAEE